MKEVCTAGGGRAVPRDGDWGPLRGKARHRHQDSRLHSGPGRTGQRAGEQEAGQAWNSLGDHALWLPGALLYPALPADRPHSPWLWEQWPRHSKPVCDKSHTCDVHSLTHTRHTCTHKGTQHRRAHVRAYATRCTQGRADTHTHTVTWTPSRVGAHAAHVYAQNTCLHTCPHMDTLGLPPHSARQPRSMSTLLGDVTPRPRHYQHRRTSRSPPPPSSPKGLLSRGGHPGREAASGDWTQLPLYSQPSSLGQRFRPGPCWRGL